MRKEPLADRDTSRLGKNFSIRKERAESVSSSPDTRRWKKISRWQWKIKTVLSIGHKIRVPSKKFMELGKHLFRRIPTSVRTAVWPKKKIAASNFKIEDNDLAGPHGGYKGKRLLIGSEGREDGNRRDNNMSRQVTIKNRLIYSVVGHSICCWWRLQQRGSRWTYVEGCHGSSFTSNDDKSHHQRSTKRGPNYGLYSYIYVE